MFLLSLCALTNKSSAPCTSRNISVVDRRVIKSQNGQKCVGCRGSVPDPLESTALPRPVRKGGKEKGGKVTKQEERENERWKGIGKGIRKAGEENEKKSGGKEGRGEERRRGEGEGTEGCTPSFSSWIRQ